MTIPIAVTLSIIAAAMMLFVWNEGHAAVCASRALYRRRSMRRAG